MKKYDWKITVWKMVKAFCYAAIPAGIAAVIPQLNELAIANPEVAFQIGLIVAVLTGINNYLKHRK